jgi:SAM-dependent methyltransferase
MYVHSPSDSSRCPLCSNVDLIDFFKVKGLPVNVCVLPDNLRGAQNVSKGDITLAYCFNCGFIHNRTFNQDLVSFEPGYEASLYYSPLFRSFLCELGERLVAKYDLRQKTMLEIGCGSGEFLKLLCEYGPNKGIGIDPTIQPEQMERTEKNNIHFIADYFSDQYVNLRCDFICCRSVFENISDPKSFLNTIRRMIGSREEVRLYFEVPDSYHYFTNQAGWSIYYEQHNHFSSATLTHFFERCGFEILEAGRCFEDGQFLYVEARPCSTNIGQYDSHCSLGKALPDALGNFSDGYQTNVDGWKRQLTTIKDRGKRAVCWGSGGKGVHLLNICNTIETIPYVVDINPRRQGLYIPGSAQQIVAPEFLGKYRPDLVIITNPLYENEIRDRVHQVGVTCDFLVV